jgi:glutamyl-tRNA synthetase
VAGRFAPSPTGQLHLGNLRTAVVAWCAARAGGLEFLVRVEDLLRIPQSDAIESAQIADLAALGITSDRPVVRQSERSHLYEAALATLAERGLTYECYCTRREIAAEIAASVSAPHGRRLSHPSDHYPGTCARLSERERRQRQREGRPAALRITGTTTEIWGIDLVAGPFRSTVDDFVVRRGDGIAAYNLAVVIDDAAQGVTQVVRGHDLLESTPRQMFLQSLLGIPTPAYAHVPLVVGSDGERLAKRHASTDGGVTLRELQSAGRYPGDVMAGLLMSTGWIGPSMIPVEIIEEIRVSQGDVNLEPLAKVLRDKCGEPARSPTLDWKVTPKSSIYRDTL